MIDGNPTGFSGPSRGEPWRDEREIFRDRARVARVLDATFNRAREGLRVLEDVARFVLDDAALTQELKDLRHGVVQAAKSLPVPASAMVGQRDTIGDVGTRATASGEYARRDWASVVESAAGRTSEALRSMEECAKLLGSATAAGQLEHARYQSYSIHKSLALRLVRRMLHQPSLCVLISERMCEGKDWRDIAARAVEGGADCLQLREKELTDRELLRRAQECVAIARGGGALCFINDRPDVALLAKADGVHLGQSDLDPHLVRGIVGSGMSIGVSTQTLGEARDAARAGADLCGVGPMFASGTKHKDRIAGPAALRDFVRDPLAGSLPHLAIGGICAQNLPVLLGAGVRGIAVCGAVCGAEDPRAACEELLAILRREERAEADSGPDLARGYEPGPVAQPERNTQVRTSIPPPTPTPQSKRPKPVRPDWKPKINGVYSNNGDHSAPDHNGVPMPTTDLQAARSSRINNPGYPVPIPTPTTAHARSTPTHGDHVPAEDPQDRPQDRRGD